MSVFDHRGEFGHSESNASLLIKHVSIVKQFKVIYIIGKHTGYKILN